MEYFEYIDPARDLPGAIRAYPSRCRARSARSYALPREIYKTIRSCQNRTFVRVLPILRAVLNFLAHESGLIEPRKGILRAELHIEQLAHLGILSRHKFRIGERPQAALKKNHPWILKAVKMKQSIFGGDARANCQTSPACMH